MKKNILAMFLCLMMVLSFANGITVKAETTGEIADDIASNSNASLEMVNTSNEELKKENLPEKEANVLERQGVEDTYTLSQKIDTYSIDSMVEEADTSNTDPNNAYVVINDTIMQGTITTAGEMRWYAFSIDEKSKVTILLQMVEALDADLYMYSLNSETYQLELIGGSATSGLGTTEYYNTVLDGGIYFFAVGGYEGTGNFAFAFYQSSGDSGNEINDNLSSATLISFDTDIKGIIDTPYDYDYYKFTVTSGTVLKYSISNTADYVLAYEGGVGDGAAAYAVDGNMIRVLPGTYYFVVYSPNSSYSSETPYTIQFDYIANASSDSNAYYMSFSENAGIVFQADPNGQNCYVNGNKIDFSYSYVKSLSNSAGSQNYNIQLTPRSDLRVKMFQTEFSQTPELQQVIPDVAHYHSSTFTSYSGPVLTLSLYSANNPFYTIHNLCSGAYSGNTLWQDLRYVNVFINPNTGKVVDIEWFNYFYEVGSHSIMYYRPYSMKYYYPYYNGQEPVGGDAS